MKVFVAFTCVKIQIPSHQFVCTVSIQDDFKVAGFFDIFTNQPIPYTRTDGCNIITFYVSYHIGDGLYKLFLRQNDFVVVALIWWATRFA